MTTHDKTTHKLGFWSAVLTVISLIWFSIGFGLYQTTLHAPWPGMQVYAETFNPAPFLAWVVPCFLLTICFLITIVCIYTLASHEKKASGMLAVIFAIAYTVILSTCYYIQMVVVEYNLTHQTTEGLSLLLFASPYPHSIPGAMEGIGYLFMSLSLIFTSKLFSGDKLSKRIRWSFLFAGLTGIIVFTDPLFPLPLIITLIVAIANAFLLIGSMILVCIWFKKHDRSAVVNSTEM